MKRVLTDRVAALPTLAEVFRTHGFEGASLSMISQATGLGKGSLYNFFPGGKQEMMAAVLADIDQWFDRVIFMPLEQASDPVTAIAAMMRDVDVYFQSGSKVCLVGWMGLGAARDPFARQVKGYFVRWVAALAQCLEGAHVPTTAAAQLAEEAVAGIQGAIILARALDDASAFTRLIGQHEARLLDAVARQPARIS